METVTKDSQILSPVSGTWWRYTQSSLGESASSPTSPRIPEIQCSGAQCKHRSLVEKALLNMLKIIRSYFKKWNKWLGEVSDLVKGRTSVPEAPGSIPRATHTGAALWSCSFSRMWHQRSLQKKLRENHSSESDQGKKNIENVNWLFQFSIFKSLSVSG